MADRLNDIDATRQQLGNIGRTQVFELFKTGQLASVKIGKRRLVPQSAIDAYITGLLGEPTGSTAA